MSKRDPSFFSFPRGSRSLFIGSRDVNQPSQSLFSIRFSLCVVKLRKWLKRGEYINIKFFKWGELLLNIWPKKQLGTVSTFKLSSWHIVKLHRSRNFVRVDIQQLKTNDHEFVDRNTGWLDKILSWWVPSIRRRIISQSTLRISKEDDLTVETLDIYLDIEESYMAIRREFSVLQYLVLLWKWIILVSNPATHWFSGVHGIWDIDVNKGEGKETTGCTSTKT